MLLKFESQLYVLLTKIEEPSEDLVYTGDWTQ